MKPTKIVVLLLLSGNLINNVVDAISLAKISTVSDDQSGANYPADEDQRSPRQVDSGDDEEDEDEETTVKGAGYEGVLSGISGIFSNLVAGNANGIVESTFNFVPPVYQKDVHNAYASIVGRTTTTTTTISPPTRPTTAEAPVAEAEEADHREHATTKTSPARPSRPATTRAPVINRPFAETLSTGDDEEDEHLWTG